MKKPSFFQTKYKNISPPTYHMASIIDLVIYFYDLLTSCDNYCHTFWKQNAFILLM